jgi:hypothetical protein
MCVLYKIKYIIHGNSVIILTQLFWSCYIAAHELYFARCVNLKKEKTPARDHLVNFSTAGRVLNLHPAGVCHFLLPTIDTNFFYKKSREAWCMVFTITKQWGGYCSFGAMFLKFIFQHNRMKL